MTIAQDERIDELTSALQQIVQWSEAYPVKVFPEPTPEQWVKMAELLKGAGMSLDSFSASNMRHVVEGVGKIAADALR